MIGCSKSGASSFWTQFREDDHIGLSLRCQVEHDPITARTSFVAAAPIARSPAIFSRNVLFDAVPAPQAPRSALGASSRTDEILARAVGALLLDADVDPRLLEFRLHD
jgi:hypothetical protein